MKFIFLFMILISTKNALAWGGRGHDTICKVASFLVKDPELKNYLRQKPQIMGHICNLPDIYWKSLGGESNQLGNPTHFMDIEIIGLKAKDIPTDYKKITAEFTGKANKFKNDGSTIKSIPIEFGSLWWRADQFFKNIESLNKEFTLASLPTNIKEEQNSDLPFNKLCYQMIVNMGLLGHFVADNSQPFHTTSDYDGYEAGHGGIHAFYEEVIVAQFDGDLDELVLKKARTLKKIDFTQAGSTIDKMKLLGTISNAEIPQILKLDPIKKKSTISKDHGMELKHPAERDAPEVGFKNLKSFVLTDLARGALLLANLWDDAYTKAGKPKLSSYRSYKYPFTVDFVAPDYP